jgi:CMP-N-acetylneuraminic acid synthetase
VVYDFIQNHECDILCWVNSTSPLQTGEEISAVIQYFISENLDSLITVKNEQVHALFNGQPVNYKMDELFAQTQDLVPVQPFVYSIMMWRTKPFIEAFEKNGHALFVGNVGFYPVNKLSSIIIKTREDLKLAEQIFKSLKSGDSDNVEYDPLFHTLLKDKPNS